MAIKIDNKASISVPAKTDAIIQNALDVIPREHMRGLNRVVLVDNISSQQRLQIPNASELPGLYHPRVGTEQPYFEIALKVLLPSNDGFFKKIAAKLNYKANLVGLLFSLQAQHYYLTLSHGVKKNQYESVVRGYMEKYFAIWRNKNAGWRAKAFKPLQPFLQKWTKKLQTKYVEEQKKAKS